MDLQKLIDKSVGVCNIPPGVHVIKDKLKFRSDMHIQGVKGETVIKIDPVSKTSKVLSADKVNNIKLTDITLDGSKNERKESINTDAHTLEVAWCKNFHIENVEVINSAGASIVIYNSEDGKILNNHIKDSGSNGILGMQHTKRVDVHDNVIEGTDHQNGIFFMYQYGKSCSDISILRNEVYDSADYGIEVGHTTHQPGDEPHRNITIKDNIIKRCVGSAIGLRSVSDAVVINNDIEDYGKINDYGCNGIFVEGRVFKCENVVIKNNRVKQSYSKVANQKHPYQQAIYITGMDNVLIEGNEIIDSHNQSIYVLASYGPSSPEFTDGRRKYSNIKVINNKVNNDSPIEFDPYASHGNVVKDNVGVLKIEGANVNESTDSEIPEPPKEIEPTKETKAALIMYRASRNGVHLKASDVDEVLYQLKNI